LLIYVKPDAASSERTAGKLSGAISAAEREKQQQAGSQPQ
jgi:hypothetical protein